MSSRLVTTAQYAFSFVKDVGPWGYLGSMMCGVLSGVLGALVIALLYLPFYMHFSDYNADNMFKAAIVVGLAAGMLLSVVVYTVLIVVSWSVVSFYSSSSSSSFFHSFHVYTIVALIVIPFYGAVVFSGLRPWVPTQTIWVAALIGAGGSVVFEFVYLVCSFLTF